MHYEIRAMSIGEIVDTSFRLLRNHFVPLVGISAIVNVPSSIFQVMIQQEVGAPDSAVVLAIALAGISLLLLAPIVSAAITFAIGRAYLGHEVRVGEAFREAMRILVPLLGTSLVAGLLMILAFLLLIVPGIWFLLGTLALTPIMVIERSFGMKAIGRSLDLLKDNRGRAFLIYLLIGILSVVFSFAFGLAAGVVPVLGTLATGLASAVTGAFLAVVAVVFYFEIRCRKEAFEIEHLAQLVEGAGAAAAGS